MCGVFGVYGHPEAANLTYLGLHALQHRGQESAGIVASDGHRLAGHRGVGHVADLFGAGTLAGLGGDRAVGHVRYSTAGGSIATNAQPIWVNCARGAVAVAHNGNLVNAAAFRRDLEASGSIFQTTSDTEVIVHRLARSRSASLVDAIVDALVPVEGAYTLLFLTEKELIAVRDPWGFRPLVLGRLGNAFVLASETCALDLIEATYVREVEPGEVLVLGDGAPKSVFLRPAPVRQRCIFELVYFARPDSRVFGRHAYDVRKELGRRLAREHPAAVDIVVPVPDSGVPAAIGYAEESGLRFEMGLIRSHYVGRTFIEPAQSIRHFGVKLKLNAVRGAIEGKRLVVVDDSLVRGTTSRKIVLLLRGAGAKEVHLRISSPPTVSPCYYGIDTPTREELIASGHGLDEIARFIGCDSLGYLSLEGLHAAAGSGERGGPEEFCNACFTENYRAGIPGSAPPARVS